MDQAVDQKVCSRCGSALEPAAFSTDKRYKDNLKPTCDACIGAHSANGSSDVAQAPQAPETVTTGSLETDPFNRMTLELDRLEQLDRPPDVNPGFSHRIDPFNRTKDKVAIVGFTKHREMAMALGDDFELWGLNELYRYMPIERFHRWFEIHPRDDLEIDDEGRQHMVDLNALDIPIYMHHPHDDIRASVRFPKSEIEQKLDSQYFTSTPAWMTGMAIAMGFEEIHVYGVDMAQECLAPTVRVLTEDLRYVPIGDVEVGDKLLAFDEHREAIKHGNRKWRTSTVLDTKRLRRPSYRVKLWDGTEMVASAGHGWLVDTGCGVITWKRTEDLLTRHGNQRGETAVIRLLETWGEDESRVGGYLAAAFDGEGTLGIASDSKDPQKRRRLTRLVFTQNENAMCREVRLGLESYGFDWRERDDLGSAGNVAVRMSTAGGKAEALRLLGTVRPERLLAALDVETLGTITPWERVPIKTVEFIGNQDVVGLITETRTLIAEGIAQHNSEYAEQRNCCEYWLGVATGKGVKVHVPDVSDLLSAIGQYGFGLEGSLFHTKLEERLEWLNEQDNVRLSSMRQLQAEFEQKKAELNLDCDRRKGALKAEFWGKFNPLSAERNQLVGGMQDCTYWKRSWAVKSAAPSSGAVPDRSVDPMTGIGGT